MTARTRTAWRRRGQRGFTLIELLITLSVTTIGLIGLLSLHLSIARGNDGASRSAEAEQITATNLESLRYWASGIEPVYLEGALERAIARSDSAASSR